MRGWLPAQAAAALPEAWVEVAKTLRDACVPVCVILVGTPPAAAAVDDR